MTCFWTRPSPSASRPIARAPTATAPIASAPTAAAPIALAPYAATLPSRDCPSAWARGRGPDPCGRSFHLAPRRGHHCAWSEGTPVTHATSWGSVPMASRNASRPPTPSRMPTAPPPGSPWPWDIEDLQLPAGTRGTAGLRRHLVGGRGPPARLGRRDHPRRPRHRKPGPRRRPHSPAHRLRRPPHHPLGRRRRRAPPWWPSPRLRSAAKIGTVRQALESHHQVGLRLRAEHEDVVVEHLEAAMQVQRDGVVVLLPDTQPHEPEGIAPRRLDGQVQQQSAEPATVVRFPDVDLLDLEPGFQPRLRLRATPVQLQVGDRLGAVEDPRRFTVRVRLAARRQLPREKARSMCIASAAGSFPAAKLWRQRVCLQDG